jgi:hypothetical protein
MIRELFPLERVVVVDIDLPKQLYKVLDEACFVLGLRQMMEHDLDELLQREALLLILHEILLYLL